MAHTDIQHEEHAAGGDTRPGPRWGWFVALGVAFVILSFLAFGNLLAATVATVYFVGILMLIGGVAHVVQAFQVRRWRRFFLWLLAGILYAVAGFFAITNPTLGAAALTLLLAISLMVSGVLRLWWGFTMGAVRGRGWIVASGIVSLIAGIVFYAAWPENTPFLLGIVLAVDLVLQGFLLIAFGLGLRSMSR